MCMCQRARPATPAEKRLEQILPDSIREERRHYGIKTGTWSDLSCLGDSYISSEREPPGMRHRREEAPGPAGSCSSFQAGASPALCKAGALPFNSDTHHPQGIPSPRAGGTRNVTRGTFDGEVKPLLYARAEEIHLNKAQPGGCPDTSQDPSAEG